jgi:hypothetical protein
MWPSTSDLSAEWQEQLCLPKHDSAPLRGHLSDDQQVEAILQGFLQFGPAAWLLIGASFRIAQLRRTPLVVLPNRRGYLKAVSVSNGTIIAAVLTRARLAYRLYSLRSTSGLLTSRQCRTYPAASASGETVLGRHRGAMHALIPGAWPKCSTINPFDQLFVDRNSQRCHTCRSPTCR